MADNYTEFSHVITDLTSEEFTWLEDILQFYPHSRSESAKELTGFNNDDPTFDDWPDFEFSLNENELWIHSEDSGDVEHAVILLQWFLIFHRKNQYEIFEYACTCSRPRPGEIGGGWAFITAEDIVWDTKARNEIVKQWRKSKKLTSVAE